MMNFVSTRDELDENNKTVDSLLMHNYSPLNHQTSPLLHIPQQMFPQVPSTTAGYPQYQFVVRQQYRKVRPEPVNERSLVGSVVGYLHERVVASVVGEKASSEANRISNNGSLSGPGSNGISPMHEIKEQIEWLHFENISQLDVSRGANHNTTQLGASAKQSALFNDANVLLIIGYKTGFSVWIIDVCYNLIHNR